MPTKNQTWVWLGLGVLGAIFLTRKKGEVSPRPRPFPMPEPEPEPPFQFIITVPEPPPVYIAPPPTKSLPPTQSTIPITETVPEPVPPPRWPAGTTFDDNAGALWTVNKVGWDAQRRTYIYNVTGRAGPSDPPRTINWLESTMIDNFGTGPWLITTP